jgi:hypothetical protein
LERAGKCTGARFTPGCNRVPKHEIFSSFQGSPARSGPLIIKNYGKNGKDEEIKSVKKKVARIRARMEE